MAEERIQGMRYPEPLSCSECDAQFPDDEIGKQALWSHACQQQPERDGECACKQPERPGTHSNYVCGTRRQPQPSTMTIEKRWQQYEILTGAKSLDGKTHRIVKRAFFSGANTVVRDAQSADKPHRKLIDFEDEINAYLGRVRNGTE